MRLVTQQQIKEIDETCEYVYNIPTLILMENAGRKIFDYIVSNNAVNPNYNFAVVCGKGNNGGDGLVCARHLINNNYNVTVYYIGDYKTSTDDVKVNYEILTKIDANIVTIDENNIPDFKNFDIVIDSIFGIGIKGKPKDVYAKIIKAINSSKVFVISIDIPSGLNGDNGQTELAINANETITLGYAKQGHFLYPGRQYTGKLTVADISLPKDILNRLRPAKKTFSIDETNIKTPIRYTNSHKGLYGHVGIIGGKLGMTGAAIMVARACFAVGAGLVSISSPSSYSQIFEYQLVEAMTYPINNSHDQTYSLDSYSEIMEFAKDKTAIVLGPGMGRDNETIVLINKLLENLNCKIILDADGIFALSKNINLLNKIGHKLVLTPHPKEMSYLTGLPLKEILSNKLNIANDFAKKYNTYLVLKGADTITTDGQTAIINTSGCDGMAVAGSGDVLAGTIAGFAAQMDLNINSISSAVYLHGKAGELSEQQLGFGMKASDIILNLSIHNGENK